MNWKIKAAIQNGLALSRVGDKLNHRLVTFSKNYHRNVVIYQSHEALRKFGYARLDLHDKLTALEIGTGYSLISAITLSLLGFEKIITVDITRDASFRSFKKQCKYLKEERFVDHVVQYSRYSEAKIRNTIEQMLNASSLQDLFALLNIKYIAPYTFNDIEKESSNLDYITSQVVLEHIPPATLDTLFQKTKKWLNRNGYCVHTINFIDHFANPGLFQDKSISEFNFLRYSDRYWNFWAGNSIAYTNRLSHLYYLELSRKYNLNIVDFIGENYRERKILDPDLIHEDVLKKYQEIDDKKLLMEFQRGTLIVKSE